MDINDFIMMVKGGNASFEDFLPQSKVKTEEDRLKYTSEGYKILFTLDEFKSKFPKVNPDIFTYQKGGFGFPILLDIDRYIYREVPLDRDRMLKLHDDASDEEEILKYIDIKSGEYDKKEYERLIYSHPDGLRFEVFFKMLNDGYMEDNIYDRFISLYSASEYGFNNVSLEQFRKIISYRTKEEEETLKSKLSRLPKNVTIYRGQGDKSTDYKDGALSWTLDINIANFFATRSAGKSASIIEATVKRDKIIEYLRKRGEEEILVFPEDVTVRNVINSSDECITNECLDMDTFFRFKDILKSFNYENLEGHNKEHSLRVLLLSLLIAYKEGLSDEETELLALAAVTHDIGRTHDGECRTHGRASFEIIEEDSLLEDLYEELWYDVDPEELKFLLEYHCKEDDEAKEFLKNNGKFNTGENERPLKLLYILKDADALDRVRFGIRALDMNYLRLKFSKELNLVAILTLKSLKL